LEKETIGEGEYPVPYFPLLLSVTQTLKLVAKYKAPTTQNFETIINIKNKD
jgi:hypothetical protein